MKAENYEPSGFSVVRGQDISDRGRIGGGSVFVGADFARSLGSAVLHRDDIVLPHRGAIGRAAIVPAGDYVMSTSLMRVRIRRNSAMPEYVLHYLCSAAGRAEILKFASTVGTPGIGQPLRSLRQVRIPLPPMSAQAKVVEFLRVVDDLIEVDIASLLAARELAKSLLQAALLQSDRCVLMTEVADVSRGLSYKGDGLADTGLPMVNMGSAENFGWLKRSGWKHYTGEYKTRHLATPADVLVVNTEQTWRNEIIGWPLLIPLDVPSALFSHHVYKIALRPGWEWMQLALWAFLFTPPARAALTGAVRGTTVANLPADALTRLQVPLLDGDDPRIGAAAALLRITWDGELEVQRLTRARDELLPLLMSGRVVPGEVAP